MTLGDSWTYGDESTDPSVKSWPAQMADRYKVNVTNLARSGSSNQRAIRIGIEELCRDPGYDWVIFPLGPASRTEVLKTGKWHQIWPNRGNGNPLDKVYTDYWHPWNDIQTTLLAIIQFIGFVDMIGPKLFITGLSFAPKQYSKEISWILNYNDDKNFNSLGMPLNELDIGINDLDRKLKSLRAIYDRTLSQQPDCFSDVITNYLYSPEIISLHKNMIWSPGHHPNDLGYSLLADYFARKIGLLR